jgi:hypothetical protein
VVVDCSASPLVPRAEPGVCPGRTPLSWRHLQHGDEVRQLFQQVLQRLEAAGMRRGEVRPRDGVSIRSEDERRAVRHLLERFRSLSESEQCQVPALRDVDDLTT